MDFKELLRSWLSFNRRERNGILVLCVLLIILLAIPKLFPLLYPPETTDFTQFQEEIRQFEEQLAQAAREAETQASPKKSRVKKLAPPPELFPFDPNNLPEEKWKALGLPSRTIRTIKNYEAKGGRFYQKEDVKRIYGLAEEQFALLEPFIRIDSLAFPQSFSRDTSRRWKFKPFPKREKVTVRINSSDSLEWIRLRGIGPVFASRILRFRNSLGGFLYKEQVMEVYGIDSTLFRKIAPNLQVDSVAVRKININSADLEQLKKHPYLSFQVARSIVEYREQHGFYRNIHALSALYSIDEALLEKIQPYLTTE